MSDDNINFYTDLIFGKVKREFFGIKKRFSPNDMSSNFSVAKYLIPFFKKHIKPTDKVIDFGCGPGTFIPILASIAHEVHGVDVVPAFVDAANINIKERGLQNAFVHLSDEIADSYDHYFDVAVMIDVLHHMDRPQDAISKCAKLLRGGVLLIIEPNRLNPAIYLLHALDRNERRLLKMGHFNFYRKLLIEYFNIEEADYNSLNISFSSKIINHVISFFDKYKLLRCFLPRLRFVCKIKN